MLFDLGWSEILLIGVVALVFVGPKDLPKVLRVAGYWVRKARNLSREFQSSIDQMIREAELDEMRQDLKKATEFDLDKEFHNTIDPAGSLAEGSKPPELPTTRPDPQLLLAPAAAEGVESIPAAPESERFEPATAEPESSGCGSAEPEPAATGSAEPAAGAAAAGPGRPPGDALRDIVPPKP